MPKITVDNRDYELESLSDEAKAQVVSIQFVDQEITRLQAQLAAMQTARIAYGNELQRVLAPFAGDTIKFN